MLPRRDETGKENLNMLKAIGNVVALLFTLSSFLVSAWAEPRLLADDEMDGIYAQGVVINLGVQLGFPEGGKWPKALAKIMVKTMERRKPDSWGGC